ncbi:PriCT-2 domain-containing protein [Nodularia chucula]|uniref:PriCT-2 domain-containing protein n=1 Tax=Nodularia chucula TaxID=3093667 RepID=UPI0039C68F79
MLELQQNYHSQAPQQPTAKQAETPGTTQEFIQPNIIRFAYNATGKNKDWDFKKLAANFQDTEGTLADVQRHIKAGHAICAGLLGGKWRSKANIIGSHWLLLDIDNSDVARDLEGKPIKDSNGNYIKVYKHQLTIEEALAHPFIQKHCALIYTTASHKPDWHKFRLVFLLPEYVEGADTVEACTRSLMQELPHDPACKDASRVFYGSTEAEFPLVNPEATLPAEWITKAVAIAHQEKIEYERRIAEITSRRIQFQEKAQANNWDIDQLIKQALSYVPQRSMGSGNYQECLQVLMALYSHYGVTDAEIIAEQWSPSIKGTTWNIGDKIRSFKRLPSAVRGAQSRRSGISIGTLFYIAKQYGFSFPKVEKDYSLNSDPRDGKRSKRQRLGNRSRTISREEWLSTHGLNREIEDFIKSLKSGFDKARNFVGKFTHKIKPAPKPTTAAPGVAAATGTTPKPTTSPNLDVDIWFQAEDRTQTYINAIAQSAVPEANAQSAVPDANAGSALESAIARSAVPEAIASGKKFILDISHTGAGKSHHVGLFTPDIFGVNTLYYLSNDHRNPTTATIEGWTDLPVRNDGLVSDLTKLTGLGNPYIRWPKPGEQPDVEGNCPRTTLFHILSAKGYTVVNEEAQSNPICQTCKVRANCAGSDGMGGVFPRVPGATFRCDRRDALADSRIRANINSLPKPQDINNAVAFVDEASRQIQPVEFIEVGLQDFDRTMMEVQAHLPAVYDQIKQLILPLRSFISGDIKPNQETYYGWNDAQIREMLPTLPDNIPEILESLKALEPDIEELVKEADSVTLDGVEGDKKNVNRDTLKYIRGAFQAQSTAEIYKNLLSLPVRWLIPLLEMLVGITQGALRITSDRKLMIPQKVTRQRETLAAFDAVVFMDATATRESMALQLGCDPKDILVICEHRPSYENLTIQQITGLGLCGRDRSPKKKAQLAAIIEELTKKHQKLGVIDHQKAKRDGDGYWFVDNRGSNAYIEHDALLLIGTPYQNIGVVNQIHSTLDQGGGMDAQAYIDHLVQTEVVQAVGRPRANRRPDEQITVYIVSEKDLSYLLDYYPGANLVTSTAFEITPTAGTGTEQTHWAIFQAFGQMVEAGEKIGIEAIAQKVGKSQSYVSQIAQEFGGWMHLKKILQTLYSSLYRTGNIFSVVLTDEEKWFVDEYLPLLKREYPKQPEEVVKEVVLMAQVFSCQAFQRILDSSAIDIKAFLMKSLLSILPAEILEQLRRWPPLPT